MGVSFCNTDEEISMRAANFQYNYLFSKLLIAIFAVHPYRKMGIFYRLVFEIKYSINLKMN